MSLTDPVEVKWDEKYEVYWLSQGRETFYDEERRRRDFNTEDEAVAWAQENIKQAKIYRTSGELSSMTTDEDGEQFRWELT